MFVSVHQYPLPADSYVMVVDNIAIMYDSPASLSVTAPVVGQPPHVEIERNRLLTSHLNLFPVQTQTIHVEDGNVCDAMRKNRITQATTHVFVRSHVSA